MYGTNLVVLTCLCLITFSNTMAITDEDGRLENRIDKLINALQKRRSLHNYLDYTEREDKDPLLDLPENGELFEEDIVMDNKLRRAVLGEKSKKSALQGWWISKWPNGVVPYVIHESFLPEALSLLNKAIHEFNTRTCIRLRKRTNEDNYIEYRSDKNQCSSNIGMMGGKQTVYIGEDCLVLGTVLHETMHVLSIIHEHSRPDRDNYIKVQFNNIKKDEWSNFNKYSISDIDNEGVQYNFASVMHYRNDAFTKNGDDTLVPRDQPKFNFGQRIEFSIGDVQQINRLYNCKKYLEHPYYHGLFKTYSGKHKKKDTKLGTKCWKRNEDGTAHYVIC